MSTLEQMCAAALARDPAQHITEFQGRWTTWGEMRRVADKVNAAIDASGADKLGPIAFAPRNRPSAIAALIGMIAGGRLVRMIYAFQSHTGIARDIEKRKPAVVVAAEEDFTDEIRATLRANGIAAVGLTEMDAAAIPGFERSTAAKDPDVAARPRLEILTSGTTGPPKQFPVEYDMIAKYMVATNLMAVQGDPLKETPVLLFMPLGNISGIYSVLPSVINGVRGILVDRFSVKAWHDHARRFRPVRGGLPPAGMQMVLDANIPKEDIASMKFIGTGAAPLDPTVQKAFEDRYGIPVLLSYGATEFGGPVTNMTLDLYQKYGQAKFGSVGRAYFGATLRVIDPETGTELPPGKEGILEVITPRMGPAWIRTSDIAMIDEDGFVFHRGRADGAIMRGGFKLLPETIERALLLHEAVSAAGVVGIPDRRLGQVPAAVVQFKPEAKQPTVAELETHLRDHVLATHIPTVWRFVAELPKTPSFKIDRPGLKRLFDTELNTGTH